MTGAIRLRSKSLPHKASRGIGTTMIDAGRERGGGGGGGGGGGAAGGGGGGRGGGRGRQG